MNADCVRPQLVCDSISASSGDAGSNGQSVSYQNDAPNCGGSILSVQTLTNPFSGPCVVFVDFTVDDDVAIDGQIYQSAGTDFTFQDGGSDPCPDANGSHSDQYCRLMNDGDQIELGVKNNFRGGVSLIADVYFSPLPSYPDTFTGSNLAYRG